MLDDAERVLDGYGQGDELGDTRESVELSPCGMGIGRWRRIEAMLSSNRSKGSRGVDGGRVRWGLMAESTFGLRPTGSA